MHTGMHNLPRMLVIDDEPVIRALLTRIFGDTFHVSCANSVDEGLWKFAGETPGIVLTDIDMPGRNGLQGVREIRKLDPFVPIVVITGSSPSIEGESILAAGANAFVAKPFHVAEIVDLVNRLASTTEGKCRT